MSQKMYYKTDNSKESMACWITEENNMDSKVSPTERRFVCVMIYLLRDSETMLKMSDDSQCLENRSRWYVTPPWVRVQTT